MTHQIQNQTSVWFFFLGLRPNPMVVPHQSAGSETIKQYSHINISLQG